MQSSYAVLDLCNKMNMLMRNLSAFIMFVSLSAIMNYVSAFCSLPGHKYSFEGIAPLYFPCTREHVSALVTETIEKQQNSTCEVRNLLMGDRPDNSTEKCCYCTDVRDRACQYGSSMYKYDIAVKEYELFNAFWEADATQYIYLCMDKANPYTEVNKRYAACLGELLDFPPVDLKMDDPKKLVGEFMKYFEFASGFICSLKIPSVGNLILEECTRRIMNSTKKMDDQYQRNIEYTKKTLEYWEHEYENYKKKIIAI